MAKRKTRRTKAKVDAPEVSACLGELPKLSDTILLFAQPLLAHLPTEPPRLDDLRKVMFIAGVAWNLPILQQRHDDESAELRELFERELERVGPDLRRVLEPMMRLRVTRFGRDRRIATFDVVPDGEGGAKIVAIGALDEAPSGAS